MRTIKEALEDGSLSLEDEIDYADMTEEEYKKEIERLTAESTEWESKCYKYQDIIKEVREYIEAKEKDDDNWVDYELLIEPIRIKEILDKEK